MLLAILSIAALPQTIRVSDVAALQAAVRKAGPGTEIVVASGQYDASLYFEDVHGSPGRPVVIRGESRTQRPRFVGWQLSKVSHVRLENLEFKGAKGNGLNVDDGGKDGSSHHIVVSNIQVSDLPAGNHDGIKLSGLQEFEVSDCVVERWGGSAVDMVGCQRGTIRSCTFRTGGDNGVQTKGGSSQIRILGCRFEQAGQRGVNLGGSTGRAFFRPRGATYEARDIRVEGCTLIGGVAPVAYVGVDRAVVRLNTIYRPGRWAIRILQETTDAEFVRCRNGVFERNLVVFESGSWASGGVNIGPNTEPGTFRFEGNHWFCVDRPDRSRPQLPVSEAGGSYGVDPQLRDAAKGDLGVRPGSPASGVGAHAFRMPS